MVFVFVYISEAHAADEWPVGHNVKIDQPKNTEERILVAQRRLADLGVGREFVLLVDFAEENNFHSSYACWPFRWYTVGSGRSLTSVAQPTRSGYDVRELVSWVVRQASH